jgi:hypothetical protein
MSGRGPDPKDLRASLVDSGWSTAPPPDVELRAPIETEESESRRLPNYEEQAPAVTQIDSEIQSRLRDMQRASLGDMQRPAVPNLPPPPPSRASRPPPALPPPPPPSAPPPAVTAEPLPSFGTASSPDVGEPLPQFGAQLHSMDSEPVEANEVGLRPDVLPPSDPPELKQRPAPVFSPPATFSLTPAPSLLSALRQRVRFAGGEVPLWSLLTPMVLLLVLGSAFAAAAVSTPDNDPAAPSASASPSVTAAPVTPAPSALASTDATPEPAPPSTAQAPALPASSIDTEALEARRAEELTKSEALALAAARRQREVARGAQLRQKLTRDPGLFKDAATLAELRHAAEDPLTAPDALGAMADAPGPLSADLLYEMWTGTVVRNSATELARSLVFSKEVRAKASPELAIALDLRIAETCEQNKELLPRVLDKGDRRSLALLAKLARKFGCGANKRQDCYPCLRDDKLVDDAMTAVKKRREPRPFLGK